MKNYNEMADDVLRRIRAYETAQKKKRARMGKLAVAFCCCALVAVLGISAQQNGLIQPDIQETLGDALYPGVPDLIVDRESTGAQISPVTESTGAQTSPVTESTARADTVVVNRLEKAPDSQVMYIALMWDDFVEMDEQELIAYYGVDIFPAVPGDLIQWEGGSYGIYRRDGGTGEVYHDGVDLKYSNEDLTRSVGIGVDKGTLPYTFIAFEGPEDVSVIGGTEVVIGQWEDGCYYAEFLYQDVGFRITTQGLTLEELVSVIASLVDA